jgi:hypothetical protein
MVCAAAAQERTAAADLAWPGMFSVSCQDGKVEIEAWRWHIDGWSTGGRQGHWRCLAHKLGDDGASLVVLPRTWAQAKQRQRWRRRWVEAGRSEIIASETFTDVYCMSLADRKSLTDNRFSKPSHRQGKARLLHFRCRKHAGSKLLRQDFSRPRLATSCLNGVSLTPSHTPLEQPRRASLATAQKILRPFFVLPNAPT